MDERTSPTDTIERLSWILNYLDGDPQSLNSLAEQSNVSWATVKKYITTIEKVQKIAPKIAIETEGIEVGTKTRAMSDLTKDPVAAFTVYLFTQAEMRGGAGEPIDKDLCKDLNGEFENALEHAIDLGWVSEVGEKKIKLTPTGMRVAGPARSEIENADQSLTENELQIHKEGSEEVVTLADEEVGSSNYQTPLDEVYLRENYDNELKTRQQERRGYPAAA